MQSRVANSIDFYSSSSSQKFCKSEFEFFTFNFSSSSSSLAKKDQVLRIRSPIVVCLAKPKLARIASNNVLITFASQLAIRLQFLNDN